MVSRREKIRKQVYKMKEQIFHKQVAVVRGDRNFQPRTRENQNVTTAHRATNTLYDNPDGILNAARLLERKEREESENLSLSEHESVSAKPVGKGRGKPARAAMRARNARFARGQRRKVEEQHQQPVLLTDTFEYDSMSDSGKTDESCGRVEDVGKVVSESTKHQLQVESANDDGDDDAASEQMHSKHHPHRTVPLSCHGSVSKAEEPQCSEAPVPELGHSEARRTRRRTASSAQGSKENSVDGELRTSGHKELKSFSLQAAPGNAKEEERSDGEGSTDSLPRRSLRSSRSGLQETSKEQAETEEGTAQLNCPKSHLQSQRSAFSFIENEISDLKKRKESEKSDDLPVVTAEVKPEPIHDNDMAVTKSKTVPALAVKLRERPKLSLSALSSRRNSRDQNGRYPKNSLVVSEEMKHRVQGRLRRRQNGLHHSRRLLNSCFSRTRMPPLSRRDLQLQTVQNDATLKQVKPEIMLKDALGVSAIQGSFRLGGKPLNSINSAAHTLTTDVNPLGIPETRSMRRKIESDLESDASERLFEKVDDEVSTRSRDVTPEKDQVQPAHIPRRSLSASKLALGRKLRRTMPAAESDSDGENAFVRVIDSEDDEYAPSDGVSDTSGPAAARRKSLRKRQMENTTDEGSRDSFASYDR